MHMKKILLSFSMLLIPLSALNAAIFLEGTGNYATIFDLKDMFGYGGSLGISVNDNFNLLARTSYNKEVVNSGDPDEKEYSHLMTLFLGQYVYKFTNLPIWLTGAGGMGYSYTVFDEAGKKQNESGVCLGIYAGTAYIATQHLSPFLEIGYHASLYHDELKNSNISGFQFMVGIRFTFLGRNKPIFEGY